MLYINYIFIIGKLYINSIFLLLPLLSSYCVIIIMLFMQWSVQIWWSGVVGVYTVPSNYPAARPYLWIRICHWFPTSGVCSIQVH